MINGKFCVQKGHGNLHCQVIESPGKSWNLKCQNVYEPCTYATSWIVHIHSSTSSSPSNYTWGKTKLERWNANCIQPALVELNKLFGKYNIHYYEIKKTNVMCTICSWILTTEFEQEFMNLPRMKHTAFWMLCVIQQV